MIRSAFVMLAGLLIPVPVDAPSAFAPTDRYEARLVEGWTVLVNKKFLADNPELADGALTLLRVQLYQVARRLPPKAIEKLRQIKFWLEEDEPHHPCMAYHPDPGWLRDHGMNPDKARCVEISNARNFLAWTFDQPWMALHELAHGYHHQALGGGFANAEITAAYDRAMEGGKYRSVLRATGKVDRAYAATNPMEYFAEATEAFFGSNDYYPFVRAELKEHDPPAFALLAKLWGTEAAGQP
jgi:hypothetical protein